MKLKTNIFICSIILWACMPAFYPVFAEDNDEIRADRTPLTFKDSGLYTRPNFIHGPDPDEEGLVNLLPPERAASADSPWSFYIFQVDSPEAADPDLFRKMAANGKKVILRVKFPGGIHAALDLEKSQATLTELMDRVNPDWLYAITLDEENVFWHGNAKTLSDLYHWCKEQWPDLPVYQWWTPMEVPNVRAESGWVALPADGWVIDLYLQSRKNFERKLVQTLETGLPVIHIVWSSPTWPLYQREGVSRDEWWEKRGRPNFDEQVDVCRGYNVPVAHFATQPRTEDATIRWAWHAKDPVVRKHYNWLETFARNLQLLDEQSIGYRELTPAKFDWVHTSEQPQGKIYGVDEQQRQVSTLTIDLAQITREPGRQQLQLPAPAPELEVACILPESAVHLTESMGVQSRQGYTTRVPVIFEIQQKEDPVDLIFEADISVEPAHGGGANVVWSTDGGETWSQPAEPDNRTYCLSIPVDQQKASEVPVQVRVTLSGTAGVDTNVAARLRAVRLTSVFKTLDVIP